MHPAESRVRKLAAETPAHYFAFDLLVIKEKLIKDQPIEKRRKQLEKFFESVPEDSLLKLSPATTDRKLAKEWFTKYSRLGLDGISLPLVLMTIGIMPLCVLISWHAITTRVRSFMAMVLIMETAMVGVFIALDFVLFYVFWEAMLIPMYLLIGVWGGANRLYAAIKFFLYTLVGSLLLLVAIFVLYYYGGHTFDILPSAKAPTLLHYRCGSSWRSSPPSR